MLLRCIGWLVLLSAVFLGGCRSAPQSPPPPPAAEPQASSGGGFYGGDLPPTAVPAGISDIPDAIPVPLPRSSTGNKPYKALGKTYVPLASASGYRIKGSASWYGKKFHGRRTSSGDTYDMFGMTAAHPTLPLPTFVRVTHLGNNRSVIVKVNDRGPFLHNRVLDLSYAAAWKLGIVSSGTGVVEVVALEPSFVAEMPRPVVNNTQTSNVANAASVPTNQVATQFMLQAGAFGSLDNALRLRQRLRRAGFSVQPESDDDLATAGAPFKVLAGPYGSRDIAQQEQQRLQNLTKAPISLFEK